MNEDPAKWTPEEHELMLELEGIEYVLVNNRHLSPKTRSDHEMRRVEILTELGKVDKWDLSFAASLPPFFRTDAEQEALDRRKWDAQSMRDGYRFFNTTCGEHFHLSHKGLTSLLKLATKHGWQAQEHDIIPVGFGTMRDKYVVISAEGAKRLAEGLANVLPHVPPNKHRALNTIQRFIDYLHKGACQTRADPETNFTVPF